MNKTEKTVKEGSAESATKEADRLLFAAIAAFICEENETLEPEWNLLPSGPMSPWKMLGRRESVG